MQKTSTVQSNSPPKANVDTSFTNLQRNLVDISAVYRENIISPISEPNIFIMNEKAEKYQLKLKHYTQMIDWEQVQQCFINPVELPPATLKAAKAFCCFVQIIA